MGESTGEDRWSQLATDLGIGETSATNPVVETSTDPNAPKRRRRRRPRKSGTGEGEVALPDGNDPLPEASEGSADDRPTKRRRRGRRIGGEGIAPPGESPMPSGAVDLDDGIDDATESVSVAHLPSWQELIDGLHRP